MHIENLKYSRDNVLITHKSSSIEKRDFFYMFGLWRHANTIYLDHVSLLIQIPKSMYMAAKNLSDKLIQQTNHASGINNDKLLQD